MMSLYLDFAKTLLKRKIVSITKKEMYPYKYVFLVTYMCQSMCKTCNIWKIYKENPEFLSREMNLDDYRKMFKSIKNKALWINFSGGEPFLRDDIPKIVKYASKKIKTLRIINIPTNGISTEKIVEVVEDILSELPSRVHLDITVSLDSIDNQLYKKIRGVDLLKNVILTYNKLRDISKRNENFTVNYQMTISKYNVNDFRTIRYILLKSEMPIFTFTHENEYFNNIGSMISIKNQNIGPFLKTLDLIRKKYPIRSVRNIIPKMFLFLAKKYLKNPNRQVIKCDSLNSTLTIDPYGYLLPCSYFYLRIDNVKNHSHDIIKTITRNKEKIEKIREIISKNKCPVCWTNCEAYPSMFVHPIETILKLVGL